MAKFIALPVNQGDAFYAEMNKDCKVLVDGGRNKGALPDLFRQYTKSGGVNVLVCTHNDADHANGVIGFLESSLWADELWLPATWLDAIRSLPRDANETISALRDILLYLPPNYLDRKRLSDDPEADIQTAAWQAVIQELGGEPEVALPSEWTEEEREGSENKERQPLILGKVLNEVADSLDIHINALSWFSRSFPWERIRWKYGYEWVERAKTILGDTKRLLKLVKVALDRGIGIRSFRHNPQNPGGGTKCLTPLSSREEFYIPPIRRSGLYFLYRAALTTVNKESLVFHLKDCGQHQPGVLFTADSDLEGVDIAHVEEGSIITAPHHGSEANQGVYKKFSKPMIWVRSDGYSKKRPCGAYLNSPGQRFCTLCRHSNRPKQAVRLYTRGGRWVRWQSELCDCK